MADREFRCPTPAQIRAKNRNWRIFRLRGLRAQTHLLTGWRLKVALWLIDRELLAMGASLEPKRPYDWRRRVNPNPQPFDIDVQPEFEDLPF